MTHEAQTRLPWTAEVRRFNITVAYTTDHLRSARSRRCPGRSDWALQVKWHSRHGSADAGWCTCRRMPFSYHWLKGMVRSDGTSWLMDFLAALARAAATGEWLRGRKARSTAGTCVNGLKRKRQSCRWRTYLRPDVKHPHLEPFTEWEAAVIVQAQRDMGNNWLGT